MSQNSRRSLSARRAWIEIQVFQRIAKPFRSLSARRAWIEISSLDDILAGVNESLSARRAWIEIKKVLTSMHTYVSLSARRAWIEILLVYLALIRYLVALRKESVDRN